MLELALRGASTGAPARLRDLGWSKARRLAFKKAKATNGAAAAAKPDYNTVRRERRAAERAAKAAQKAGNGHSNGNGERISAEAGDDLNLGCMSGR